MMSACVSISTHVHASLYMVVFNMLYFSFMLQAYDIKFMIQVYDYSMMQTLSWINFMKYWRNNSVKMKQTALEPNRPILHPQLVSVEVPHLPCGFPGCMLVPLPPDAVIFAPPNSAFVDDRMDSVMTSKNAVRSFSSSPRSAMHCLGLFLKSPRSFLTS